MSRGWHSFIIGLAFLTFASSVFAEEGRDAVLQRLEEPAKLSTASTLSFEQDNKVLHLTLDKTELVRLDQDAASIIVNNPDHISVMLDSPRLLIVMPRLPGATSFTVLNSRGEIVLEKSVIVGNNNVQQKYVRIRKMCSASDSACVPAAYYYCPDGCYEVTPVTPAASTNPPVAAVSSGASAMSQGAAGGTQEQAPQQVMPNNPPSESQ